MNAVEIEEAVSELAGAPFDPSEFPFALLAAFGNKDTTLRKLRQGASNRSDVPGGVLQRGHIHIAPSPAGGTERTLAALRASPATYAQKARFLLATDGETLVAEELAGGETIACPHADLDRHFGFLLPLAGITAVAEIKNNPIDIKATSRLNKLYVQLLRDNEDWGTAERRPALNEFMARLIFCFFAEDTGIFHASYPFTKKVEEMSAAGGDDTHAVLAEMFKAMNTPTLHEGRIDNRYRKAAGIKGWADVYPYVNGGLFTDDLAIPRFSRMARSYLLAAGRLDWREINPDIFGSMIQAVADDAERGELGMHYTSVPNILKVLNPLFLDGLREQLAAAGDNARKLRNLRRRIAAIRVFDPACGSGNFLVIAYRELRGIEAEIVARTGDEARSRIALENFFGIEIKGFAAEIARLALLIAEFQADCRHLSQSEACLNVLPLHRTGKIVVGNALRLDWLEVCPPVAKAVVAEHDLGGPTGRLALEENGLGEAEPETYVCGNPPYKGSQTQTIEQKADLEYVFRDYQKRWPSLDYISGWFFKAALFLSDINGAAAFVSTNSVAQGEQVPLLWPLLFSLKYKISFCYTSFRWQNLASYNAGVTVVVVGFQRNPPSVKNLYESNGSDTGSLRQVSNIGPYLIAADDTAVQAVNGRPAGKWLMLKGNQPTDGGYLCLSRHERDSLVHEAPAAETYVRRYVGSQEMIRGEERYCIWVEDDEREEVEKIAPLAKRFELVATARANSVAPTTRPYAAYPYKFRQIQAVGRRTSIIIPSVSSERREYLPVSVLGERTIVSNLAFALYDSPLWNLALIASRLHLVWIATVCGKMKTDFRYSNTLGWNTFPVPPLTDANKAELTACAENILLAREAHYPATIADLYDPKDMPADLRRAHDANDEALERIYIGRRFRNDTERLEKLFAMYAQMTAGGDAKPVKSARKPRAKIADAGVAA